jgi:hypothetical protein
MVRNIRDARQFELNMTFDTEPRKRLLAKKMERPILSE